MAKTYVKKALDPARRLMPGGTMQPNIRAMIAASAYAYGAGRKVSGLYDHTWGRHLRIAAEARDDHLQGYDGDRDVRFGGTLPELREAGGGASFHMTFEKGVVRGYDRTSGSHFSAEVGGTLVQIFDYGDAAWFAFDVHVA